MGNPPRPEDGGPLTPQQAEDLLTPLTQAEAAVAPQGTRILLGLVAAGLVFLGVAGLVVAARVDQNTVGVQASKAADSRLSEAIRVACTVTANVVTRTGVSAGRSNGGPTGRPAPLSAQQRLSSLRVRVIRHAMTRGQRRLEMALLMEITKAGGLVVPDCKRIAEHPEDVKLYIPNVSTSSQPKPRPRGSPNP